MRYLERNQTKLWVRKYKGETDEKDAYGNFTGEVIVQYEEPIEISVALYPASGDIVKELFGEVSNLRYIMTINTDFSKLDKFYLEYPSDRYLKISSINKSLNVTQYGLEMFD